MSMIKIERLNKSHQRDFNGILLEPKSLNESLTRYINNDGIVYYDKDVKVPGFVSSFNDEYIYLNVAPSYHINESNESDYYIIIDSIPEPINDFCYIVDVIRVSTLRIIKKSDVNEYTLHNRDRCIYKIDWNKLENNDIKYISTLLRSENCSITPFIIDGKLIRDEHEFDMFKNECVDKYLKNMKTAVVGSKQDEIIGVYEVLNGHLRNIVKLLGDNEDIIINDNFHNYCDEISVFCKSIIKHVDQKISEPHVKEGE